METKSGCEMIRCRYFRNGVCTDDDANCIDICRYNRVGSENENK